jgi:ABC-type Mn2+/Zn2+ transport system ATPase subunit
MLYEDNSFIVFYFVSEIFLLDEPLASMKDSQKGQALFYLQNVLDYLLQAGKTVVLATQVNLVSVLTKADRIFLFQLLFQFLAKCQKIYFLEDGKILKDGTYFDFLNVAVFAKMIKEYEVLRNSEGYDVM